MKHVITLLDFYLLFFKIWMDLSQKQCLCLSLAERSRFSEGEIQTFMSVDADRTINLCNSLHDAWRYFTSQSHNFFVQKA
jgi:hypothetical protein